MEMENLMVEKMMMELWGVNDWVREWKRLEEEFEGL